jgi:regulatory protein
MPPSPPDGRSLKEQPKGAPEPDPPDEAVLEASLRLLAMRARSIRELKDRLLGKGFDSGDVSACVRWLQSRKLLDDEAFARSFTRDRLRLSPRSPYVLTRELRQRGIAPELAGSIPERVISEEGWTTEELAARVAESWVRRQGTRDRESLLAVRFSPERERARRKLLGFLARRGFATDAARFGLEAAENLVRALRKP